MRWISVSVLRARRQFDIRTFCSGRLKVAVGMSGGVDSSVAALLLKQEGHEVVGIYMRNWDAQDEKGASVCPADADYEDTSRVCKQIGIELVSVDYSKRYWMDVFENFAADYELGRTPNPDLSCNRHVKFDALLEHVLGMGANKLATGHYARLSRNSKGLLQLLRGVDSNKDQTYFLASVKGQALENVLFPLGEMLKSEVRARAASAGLSTAYKRSSAGICFVGRRKFTDFISDYVEMKPGNFISVTDKTLLGRHNGLPLYTYGQRAKIGGASEAWYVVGKDATANVVFVAQGPHHPALFCQSAIADSLSWISGEPPAALREGRSISCLCKIRYSPSLERCLVFLSTSSSVFHQSSHWVLPCGSVNNDQLLEVRFENPARAVTPGQALVLYDGDVCLGGGIILAPGRTMFEEQLLCNM